MESRRRSRATSADMSSVRGERTGLSSRFVLLLLMALLTPSLLWAAPKPKEKIEQPDFTKGGALPGDASVGNDLNLGATGIHGWMFAEKMSTAGTRQVLVRRVEAKSPADRIVMPGDVVLGIDGGPFSSDPRIALGKALTQAETQAAGGKLSLRVWRKGETKDLTVTIPVLGSYSDTAPYDCPKSKRIVELGCAAIARAMAEPNYARHVNPITRSLNAMALLGSGDPKYLPLVKSEAQWASNYQTNGFTTWWYGYTMMFCAEYIGATDDKSILPGLRRMALESARGQSIVGSWGHGFAGADGLCTGYGMMNAPGIPLTISLIEAKQVGVDDPEVASAIERSVRLLNFYIGKGSIPYGDHEPWLQHSDGNGKNSEGTLLFNLMDNKEAVTFFSHMSLASYGEERDTGHTGNFLNILWAIPGIQWSGPHATGAWMKEYGAWYFDLARHWDGTFDYQGQPSGDANKYTHWDCTGAYLLSYEMPLKKLWITGKKASIAPQLSAEQARQIMEDGRGFTHADKHAITYYTQLSQPQLLERLGNGSPTVRSRAAEAAAKRGDVSVQTLIAMLDAPVLEQRLGACAALEQMGDKATPAVPALVKTLDDPDMWLRCQAADALAGIGEAGNVALPKLLKMLSRGPTEDDPRNMQQRYLSFAVFGKMLKKSLHGVDKELLREAVAAGLRNQDGRARGTIGAVYNQLTYEEIKPLLPAIRDATAQSAPSGIMFASGIRIAGLNLLAKHRIREGIDLCFEVLDLHKWGKSNRVPACLKALEQYGTAAKPTLPRLRTILADLEKTAKPKKNDPDGEDDLVTAFKNAIKSIENSTQTPELRGIGE